MDSLTSKNIKYRLGGALVALAAFLLAALSPVSYADSDPRGALLTAQAIIEKGTVKLDSYYPSPSLPQNWIFVKRDGHVYYLYPLGTALVSLPAVYAARMAGWDMLSSPDDLRLQKILAGLACAGSVWLMFLIAGRYLPPVPAAGTVIVTFFGSAMASTMGSALWSHDYAVTFALWSILIVIKIRSGEGGRIHDWLLGALLFLTYLTRPTFAMFIAPLGLMMLAEKRFAVSARAAGAIAIGLACLVLFSMREFGTLLPHYYFQRGVFGSENFLGTLLDHLFTPARGLFVHSPFLPVVFALTLFFAPRLARKPLFVVSGVWFALNLAAVSRLDYWWGGWCFGARMLVDTMPALFVITLETAREAGGWPALKRDLSYGAYVLLGAAAIFINTYQGLYNPATYWWNDTPNIEKHPEYLYNWKYPQFAATYRKLEEKELDYFLGRIEPIHPGDWGNYANYDAKLVFNTGWSPVAGERRWSQMPVSAIYLRPGDDFPRDGDCSLALVADSLAPIEVSIAAGIGLREESPSTQPVGKLAITPGGMRLYEIALKCSVLTPGKVNRLEFADLTPGAENEPPRNKKSRFAMNAIRFSRLTAEPAN